MVSYSTSDFKVGLKIIIDNDPCVIIEEEFNKPGKGQAFSKIKFRNFLTGRVGEKTCKVGESLESADVEELDMQFLYSDDSAWFFMHPETYDQIPVSVETVGELGKWVTEEDRQTLYDFSFLLAFPGSKICKEDRPLCFTLLSNLL